MQEYMTRSLRNSYLHLIYHWTAVEVYTDTTVYLAAHEQLRNNNCKNLICVSPR